MKPPRQTSSAIPPQEGNWQKIKIGEFLKPYRIEHIVQNDKNYRQVTISKNHGISFRGEKLGNRIGRKRQFVIDLKKHPNTILFTRQGVLDGAIGVAPQDVDTCIVTENMPMMSVDTVIIEMAYLRKLLLSDYLYEKIGLLTVIGSAQKSIHERDFLNIEIELPNLEIQKKECKKFDSLDIEHSSLKQEITHQQIFLKKLRQQILQEAIQGKLTQDWRVENSPPQEGNWEPASELLKRIQAEKQQLIKDKKIKPQKPLPPISEAEKPFNLPEGWVWCRLGNITNIVRGGSPRPAGDLRYYQGEIPFLKVADLTATRDMYLDKYTYTIKRAGLHKTRRVSNNTLMLTNSGATLGVPKICNFETTFNDGIAAFIYMNKGLYKPYFYFLLTSKTQWFLDEASRGQGQPNLNIDIIGETIASLPPLAEQKAIVAKVEKLLTICDKLEIQITQNQHHAEQLMQSVLKEAFSLSNERADPPVRQTGQVAAHA